MGTGEIQQKIRACLAKMPQRNNVRKLSLFGSHVRGQATSKSDIDLLIELEEPVGYFELVRIQEQLEKTLGQPVDLVTPKALSKYFRDEVLAEAQPLYEK
ncbi:MAG: nucleotidyltransferase family protein [Candidatus Andersenbacteria bacterium]|nr:nucleotidyltransferase family protein [Candidatus Andersenbacteria bacterium]